ncbi:hypothetical protein HFO42_20180 [Rhizobium leguminosarum]|uniref:Uncharacterized protein n=1 Tax=Rhizobium leguminosarum TaxID=384 RepID=A0AAJ1AA24_RHILE|nr:hypothetical protein [Rhizobium leguminosarum]MBY5630409.1 hypothetical protein [Rhizobium leguminosarum]
MKIGDYKQHKTREIVEDAISQLCAVGFTPDGAAALLVTQGIIRIKDRQKRKDLAAFVAQEAEDTIN